MRKIFNILLLLLAGLLAFLLYKSIEEPIAFEKFRKERKGTVVAQLESIREAQKLYQGITGEYAADFDTLADVLTNGSFSIIKVIGDPDDPNFTGEITYDTILRPAIDSVRKMNIDLANLRFVPYTDKKKTFDIDAAVVVYQSTDVPVVQVGTPWNTFMGTYGDPRFAQYDQKYNPKSAIKFGDMTKPNLNGNWE